MRHPRSGRTLAIAIVAAVVLGIAAWGARAAGWFGTQTVQGEKGAPVKRGPLKISVIERGNLKSKDSITLKSEIEGQTTILYLIEEGKHVEAGTLLCELDATKLDEQRVQQQITVRNAEAAYVKAAQSFEIQKSQNDSDVSAAQRKLDFAQRDLKKYLEGDWPQKQQSAKEAITLAEEEVTRAKDKLDWSQKLSDKGFLTRTELEADRLSAKSADIKFEQAKRSLSLLEDYDYPRQRKMYEADVEESNRGLERAQLQAKARLVDAEAAMNTSKDKLGLEQERLAKLVLQIDKAKLRAPVAGMVVYAQQEGSRMGSSDPIQEGTSVRERQDIITLPAESGQMLAEASLHESVLEQVQEGQRVMLSVDALPGRQFAGRVDFKAVLPDKGAWWANPNLRLYRTQIALLEADAALRPGMSCSLEILVDEIPDALYAPLQSVFLDKGKAVVFLSKNGGYEMRSVKVGKHSSEWVQLLDGVSEGDVLLLSQPIGSTLAPALQEEPEAPVMPDFARPPAGGEGRGASGALPARGNGGAPAAAEGEAGAARNREGRGGGAGGERGGRPGGGRERGAGARPGGSSDGLDGSGGGGRSGAGTDGSGARPSAGAEGAQDADRRPASLAGSPSAPAAPGEGRPGGQSR